MGSFDLLLAALPVLIVIGLLLLRTPALFAVSAGILATLVLTFRFPFEGRRLVDMAASLSWVTFAVAVIMLGGIVLSAFLDVSGAQDAISDWLNRASGDPHRAVLLLGLGVTPFMESTIGWGAGVIVGAPLLLRTGLTATRACAIALLGLFMCPWGTLGSGFLVVTELAGLDPAVLGQWTALFNMPVIIVMGIAIYIVGIGRQGSRRLLGECLIALAVIGAALYASNAWIAPPLSGVFAAFAGIVCILLCARLAGNRALRLDRGIRRALAPYTVLMGSILVGVAAASLPVLAPFATVLKNPAPWIVVTVALTPLLLGLGRPAAVAALKRSIVPWWSVFLVTALFLAFGVLLATNGMSTVLAEAAVSLGGWFVPLIPILGAVFGYITTSNTATAALTTPGAIEIATALRLDTGLVIGAITAAAGALVPASAARIALAVGIVRGQRRGDEAPVDTRRVVRIMIVAALVVTAILVPLVVLLSVFGAALGAVIG